jgi:putative SOS response-associated peptidase YedK
MWIIVEYINDDGAVYNIGLATTNTKLLVFLRQYADSDKSADFKEVTGMMREDLSHIHKRMLPMMTGAASDIYAQWMDPDV